MRIAIVDPDLHSFLKLVATFESFEVFFAESKESIVLSNSYPPPPSPHYYLE